MWAVENHTPYAVERTWGRDKDGVHEWIVAVKATFNIKSDGNLLLADEQLEHPVEVERREAGGARDLVQVQAAVEVADDVVDGAVDALDVVRANLLGKSRLIRKI